MSPGGARVAAVVVVLAVLGAAGCGTGGGARRCGGVMTREQCAVFGSDVHPRAQGAFGWEDAEVVPARGSGSTSALRVHYPAGSASQTAHRDQGAPAGGAQVYLPLTGGSVEALRLSYAVRFSPGFDFNRGGKLPGLYGGTRTAGGRTPDGTDGFSTRLMWRTGGAGEIYAYLPSSVEHGTSLGRGRWRFVPGRWYYLEEDVTLNTPGRDDGAIVLTVDGERVLDERHLEFRSTGELQVEGVFFSTFFGGRDRSWASPSDQYADFTGFAVTSEGVRRSS